MNLGIAEPKDQCFITFQQKNMSMCLCRGKIIVFYIFFVFKFILQQLAYIFDIGTLIDNISLNDFYLKYIIVYVYYNFLTFTFGCIVYTWSFHSFDEIPVCHFAGDPRRPYPTDFEMRLGFLGKVGDLPLNTPVLQSQGSYGEPMSSNRNTAQTGQSLL